MDIDHKYEVIDVQGLKTSNPAIVKKGTTEEVNDYIIFRAQDAGMVPLLNAYWRICKKLGSPEEHLDGIKALRARVQEYQEQNIAKTPD
jgi:hypothetical protein